MVLNMKKVPTSELQSERPARLQNRYVVLRKLGEGTYGRVQLALNKETNQEVAIKTIKKAKISSEEDMLRIRREMQIMASIQHPHIIHINEVFETRQKIVIVMQYASGGELYDYLGCHHKLPEAEARRIFRQIASAIYYCHKNMICHRDLKLENILLDEAGNAKIADFGLSNIFDDKIRMNTFCGSPLYASPEIVKGTTYKGPEVDCWSLGVILYTLIYGAMPFDGKNFKDLVSQISEGRYKEPANKSNASDLIRRLLTPDISKRATVFDICRDSWVNDSYDTSLSQVSQKLVDDSHVQNRIRSNFSGNLVEDVRVPVDVSTDATEKRMCQQTSTSGPKGTFHEQMLKMDVNFMLNKLLAAVEVSLASTQNKSLVQLDPATANKTPPSSSLRLRNGGMSSMIKSDSAYVMPIFEVTSTVPAPRITLTKSNKNYSKTLKPNVCNEEKAITEDLTSACKNSKLKSQRKSPSKKMKEAEICQNVGIPHPTITVYDEGKDCLSTQMQSINALHDDLIRQTLRKTSNESLFNRMRQPEVVNGDNRSSESNSFHTAASKSKKPLESLQSHKKHMGCFFRTKNHALSLAQIFSSQYEKLIRSSVQVTARKRKQPGKITIPATFNPATMQQQSCNDFERKERIFFPTVSVSENKQRIEKRIDKMKKAALNMSFIRRSNTMNRIKIEKFLKSQAKKMQGLVFEDQKTYLDNTECIHHNQLSREMSEQFISAFEKRSFQPFFTKLHNKKTNFLNICASNSTSSQTIDFTGREYWKFGSSECLLTDNKTNFDIFSKTKSKSEMDFSSNDTDLSALYNTFTESNCVPHEQNLLNLLQTSKQIEKSNLWRSASDSGSVCFKKSRLASRLATEDCPGENFTHCTHYAENMKETLGSYYSEKSDKYLKDEKHASDPTECNVCLDQLQFSNQFANIQIDTSIKHDKHEFEPNDKIPQHLTNENRLVNFHKIQNETIRQSLHGTMKIEHRGNSSITRSSFDTQNKPLSHSENIDNEIKHSDDIESDLKRCHTFDTQRRFYNAPNGSTDSMAPKILNNNSSTSDKNLNSFCVHQKEMSNFSSIPNLLYLTPDAISPMLFKQSASAENINVELSIEKDFPNGFLNKNQYPENNLSRCTRLDADDQSVMADVTCRIPRRTQSFNEDVLSKKQQDNCAEIRNRQNILSEHLRLPYQSKFLTELELHGHRNGNKNADAIHIHSSSDRRVKSEKRSQSFLQLLSLKRIHEAEKELDKRENLNYVAEENQSGSLLEALKMYGYKNVLSQRFPGSDLNTEDEPLSIYTPKRLSAKNRITNVANFDLSGNSLLQMPSVPYDLEVSDTQNDFPTDVSLPTFNLSNNNIRKQFLFDWLTATQSEDSSLPNQEDFMYSDDSADVTNADHSSHWDKESSYEGDSSFNIPKELVINGVGESKIRSDAMDTTCSQGVLHSTPQIAQSSSISQDGETVKDRIWRKSFYSRFNSSVLSRKEKPAFFKPDILRDNHAGKSDHCHPLNNVNYKDERFDFSKRSHWNRKYSQTKPLGPDYVVKKQSKSYRDSFIHTNQSNKATSNIFDGEQDSDVEK